MTDRKTHCIHGHEYTMADTLANARGWRSCKACAAKQARARYRKCHPVPAKRGPKPKQRLRFTAKETAVLERLALGETDKEIARALGVTPEIVKGRLTKVARLSGASNRSKKLLLALAIGFESPVLEHYRGKFGGTA